MHLVAAGPITSDKSGGAVGPRSERFAVLESSAYYGESVLRCALPLTGIPFTVPERNSFLACSEDTITFGVSTGFDLISGEPGLQSMDVKVLSCANAPFEALRMTLYI